MPGRQTHVISNFIAAVVAMPLPDDGLSSAFVNGTLQAYKHAQLTSSAVFLLSCGAVSAGCSEAPGVQ